jgi:hypothetical protein
VLFYSSDLIGELEGGHRRVEEEGSAHDCRTLDSAPRLPIHSPRHLPVCVVREVPQPCMRNMQQMFRKRDQQET